MKRILEYIFPENIYCICCGSIIDRTRAYSLCDTCMGNIRWNTGKTCRICGKALSDAYDGELCYDCIGSRHFFDRCISAVTYGNHERAMISDFKYGGRSYMARHLGEIMYDRLAAEGWEADCITNVPAHEARKDQRGYDQAELLAKEISRRSGIPYRKLLIRREETAALKKLSRAERFIALADAFDTVHTQRPDEKNILVVDDIYTTGATMDACAKVLKADGADRVYGLAFASGINRRPDI